ncbi:MAG: hypothetical protein WD118_04925 [Phycisphaeraceae bacterium]
MTAVLPESAPPHAVRCLKAAGVRSVWLVEAPGEAATVVKTWPCRLSLQLKRLLGIAQPQRQARGSRRLAAAGVATPTIRCAWRMVRRGRVRVVELEHDYVAGRLATDLFRDATLPAEQRRRIARALGALAPRIAVAGLVHRDMKLENLIVPCHGDGLPNGVRNGAAHRAGVGEAALSKRGLSIWAIDTVGVGRMLRRPAAVERMLVQLMIEPITEGLAIDRGEAEAVLRAALRPLPPNTRRAVLRRLRRRKARTKQKKEPRMDTDGHG